MSQADPWRMTRGFLMAACFALVVGAMKLASDMIVPFLLAAFIAVITTPLFIGMQRRGVPAGVALLLLILGLIAVISASAVAVGQSMANLIADMPAYREVLHAKTSRLVLWLHARGIAAPERVLLSVLNPQVALDILGNVAAGMSALLGNVFIILLIAVFMLLEAAYLPAKLQRIPKTGGAVETGLSVMVENVRHYMGIKTAISLATGVLAALWVALLGIGSPLMMGLLAFLLNYIPNIGSIIAAIPPILLALLTLGIGRAVLCAVGYVAINMVFGNIIEPRVMGKGLGLSPLVVVLTMVFWGWVFGPVGLLLSAPLTMVTKIILDSFEETRWVGVLMGAAQSGDPAEERGSGDADSGKNAQ